MDFESAEIVESADVSPDDAVADGADVTDEAAAGGFDDAPAADVADETAVGGSEDAPGADCVDDGCVVGVDAADNVDVDAEAAESADALALPLLAFADEATVMGFALPFRAKTSILRPFRPRKLFPLGGLIGTSFGAIFSDASIARLRASSCSFKRRCRASHSSRDCSSTIWNMRSSFSRSACSRSYSSLDSLSASSINSSISSFSLRCTSSITGIPMVTSSSTSSTREDAMPLISCCCDAEASDASYNKGAFMGGMRDAESIGLVSTSVYAGGDVAMASICRMTSASSSKFFCVMMARNRR